MYSVGGRRRPSLTLGDAALGKAIRGSAANIKMAPVGARLSLVPEADSQFSRHAPTETICVG